MSVVQTVPFAPGRCPATGMILVDANALVMAATKMTALINTLLIGTS
jgi:hypothetical protein